MFEVQWSGAYPNKCSGEWEISYNGIPFDLPDDIRENPMNTQGTFQKWWFDKNWVDVWDEYESGLPFPEWLDVNKKWIISNSHKCNVALWDMSSLEELYTEIQKHDWRHNSCGGCI